MANRCGFWAITAGILLIGWAAGADGPQAFEVASVKPAIADARGLMLIRPQPGGLRYVARNVPLRLLIKAMYKITDSQIIGGPGWMESDRFDIDAKAAHPSTVDQLHEMFKTLLADRFQLRFHRETREMLAYVMTAAKPSATLKPSEIQELYDIPIQPDGPGGVAGKRVSMAFLAWYLSQQLSLPVVDRTALDGYYDFTLRWPPRERAPEPPASPGPTVRLAPPGGDPFPERLTAAVREQLGLSLVERKAPVEVLVIDHAAKPEPN